MTIFKEIASYGVVPVIAIDDAKDAAPLAAALIEGGLPIAEITFRTKAAAEAIKIMSDQFPKLLIGAGTIITNAQVKSAQQAGAKFALSPGIDAEVTKYALDNNLPFAPGIMTPSDLQQALKLGLDMVKFFPAMASGGPSMLKNIAAPYLHTGIGFNPTGGVNLQNIGDWLSLPFVRAVGGTWIATKEDIAQGNWEAISQKAAEAVMAAKNAREAK